jgi:glycosyltransferase involved in cell wall biosynthesis
MRVLMVTSSYPKFPGDVTAPFIEAIARGVAARGHEVDVVLPAHPELRRSASEPVRFFPYAYAPRPEWSRWGYAQSLRADVGVRGVAWLLAPLAAMALRAEVASRLVERRYDVAHVHWVVPNAALVADVLSAHAAPVVVSLHGSDVFLAERLLPARVLARRALRQAGAVTACSADLRRRALRLGARPERTSVIPYGVDLEGFSPHVKRAGVRARLGVPEDAFLVVGLGRLVEKKGFRHLIDAVARLDGVHLVIAGDGDLRAALQEQARRSGVSARFPGALERDAMAATLAVADVVVIPSVMDTAGNVDGLPNALLESLAAGKAVVASRVAGIPDVVEDGRNGLLVPEKDAAALAAAVDRLRREPETRRRLGEDARRGAERALSWDAAARRFEECYAQASALDAR